MKAYDCQSWQLVRGIMSVPVARVVAIAYLTRGEINVTFMRARA